MLNPWVQKNWRDAITEYSIRECTVCTSLIATDRKYGRRPSTNDVNICECCEVPTWE